MPPGNQTRTIEIKVKTDAGGALKSLSNQFGAVNKNTKSMAGNMRTLTNAFQGWLAYLGVREIVRMSDDMQNLSNRLKIVTNDGRSTGDVLEMIGDIAKRTYVPIRDVGEAYVRMGSALRNIKADSSQLGALTETLINTFRVAGTTTTETTNTMIQLSQAFSSGEVRGQELRSVLEQNAVLAGYLRKEFKGDLMKTAADGMLRASTITGVLIKNFDELQMQAKNLTPTFEQAVANAMTDFQLAVHKVNQELGISVKFFNAMTWIVENAGSIISGVAAGAITFLIAKVAALSFALGGLRLALLAIATNPLTWAVVAAGSIFLLVQSLGGLEATILKVKIQFYEIKQGLLELDATIYKAMGNNEKYKETMDEVYLTGAKVIGFQEDLILLNKKLADEKNGGNRVEAMKEELQRLKELQEANEGMKTKAVKVKEILGELNRAYLDGAISISTYNEKLVNFQLYKLNREFREGKMDVFAYNEQMEQLKIQEFNRDVANGTMALQDFNMLMDAENLKNLDAQFQAGRISLQEYNTELLKLEDKVRVGSAFQAGVASYIESVGTLSQGIASGIDQAFGHLETNFMEFIKTGKFNFRNFAQSVLDDLTKIIVRASIIRPLAQGIMNFGVGGGGGGDGTGSYGSSAPGGSYMMNAKGNAFDNGNVIPFARGGIVNSPTAFSFGGNKTGLMGEAGSEAIMPLTRTSSGNLGVEATTAPVIINITNNSDASTVTQTESTGSGGERIIEVTIDKVVSQGLMSGKYDKAMRGAYGLGRKGS